MNSIYNEYLKVYKKLYPNGDLNSKDYTNTIIRNIIIYFLYKHYKDKRIDRLFIIANFNIKHVNSIYQKINEVDKYIANNKTLLKKREVFMYFFYKFYKVFIKIKNQKNDNT